MANRPIQTPHLSNLPTLPGAQNQTPQQMSVTMQLYQKYAQLVGQQFAQARHYPQVLTYNQAPQINNFVRIPPGYQPSLGVQVRQNQGTQPVNATPNQQFAQPRTIPFSNPYQNVQRTAQQPKKNVTGASMIKFVPLPFYEIKRCIVSPSRLEQDFKRAGQSMSQKLLLFTLPNDVVDNLLCESDASLPKYELQMRIGSFDTSSEQMDNPPATLNITVNLQSIILPPVMKTNVQGKDPTLKRAQLPIDLTPGITCPKGSHLIRIEWKDMPNEPLAFGVWLVEKLTSEALHQRFMEKGQKQPVSVTQQLINTNFGDSDGIAVDSLKVSLKCPLTQCLMTVPVRSTNCSHLTCFDLLSYLKLNELKTKWKCPVCNKLAPYDTLKLDLYFADLIKKAADSASEVELFPNNRWEFVGAKRVVQKRAVVDCGVIEKSSNQLGQSRILRKPTSDEPLADVLWREITKALDPQPQQTPRQTPTQAENIDIITLDDSDEEDTAKESQPISSRKRKYDQITTDPNGITVITLSDDEED